jgi:hypothetical protein
VSGIQLSQNTATLHVGGTVTLEATIFPNNAANQNVSWTISNPGVADVTGIGLIRTVTAASVGSTAITATTECGGFYAQCVITVNPVTVTGITLLPSSTTILEGGTRINDRYYGLTHDHTHRTDILHKEIFLPDHAPSRFIDLETLVNEIEHAEKRKDSRIAKEIIISLFNNHCVDKERAFNLKDYVELVKSFVNKVFISQGRCAIIAIHEGKNKHDPARNNPHVHILLTDRPVDRDGFCKKKNREWNNKAIIRIWRELWADEQNKAFELKGIDIKVSAKNLIMQGYDREPTKHLGYKVIALKKRGIQTDRSIEHHSVIARNKAKQERKIQRELERTKGLERERSR